MNTYPAEPWILTGHSYVGVWLLPRDVAPSPHSAATKPITIFGRNLVSAAFFIYAEPSSLTYDEVMVSVLVREGWRLRVSITHIWVNSPASRDGGRALWAIPKELAEFTIASYSSYAAQGIGSLSVTKTRRLPFSLPTRFKQAQDRDGELVLSPVKGRVRHGIAKGRWSFATDGPLGFLDGRKPLLTMAMRPFDLLFGSAADDARRTGQQQGLKRRQRTA